MPASRNHTPRSAQCCVAAYRFVPDRVCSDYRDARALTIICNVIRSRSRRTCLATDLRIRNPQVALSKGIYARGFTMPDRSEASRCGAGWSRKQALARWHQDRWFEAKLSRPPRITPVIKRKKLAAGFAGSKVQRVGKVDSLTTMT